VKPDLIRFSWIIGTILIIGILTGSFLFVVGFFVGWAGAMTLVRIRWIEDGNPLGESE